MSWKSLLGHEAAVRAFQLAWKKGRLAHAYLLIGPEGVGKRTFAGELSKALLCGSPKEPLEACDTCSSCTHFDAGTLADFSTFSRPEEVNEFPISVIRELSETLALKPMHGTRKIAVLDNADELNDASANAFLKTLEEPPPGSILFLIGGPTAETQLSTIVSRCQVIRFAPLSADELRRWLASRGVTDREKQERLIRLSRGSPGQALALDDDELWEFRGAMLHCFADPARDTVQTSKDWMKFIEGAGKESSSQRRRAGLMVRLLVEILDFALRSSLKAEVQLEAKEQLLVAKLGERLGPELLMKWVDRCLEAEMHLDRKVQLILLVEGLIDALREPSPPAPAPK